MKLRLFIIILLAAMLDVQAQKKPKLVVNIVVGQMRYDYLLRFRDNLSDNGFNRMINKGVSCDRAMYNYLTTSTPSGLATVSTGANPSIHGVIGKYWFNYTNSEKIELVMDPSARSIGTDELDTQVSPRGMVANSLGDALKTLSPQSKVISIALEPTSAVIMGGYSADAIYWLSPREGRMVTSSYYQSYLPEWVKSFNGNKYADNYSGQKWTRYLAPSRYKSVFSKDIVMDDNGGISLDMLNRKSFDYDKLVTTPFANTMLRDFAVQAIYNESLGEDEYTDLLTVVFDPMRLIGEKYGTQSVEIEDAYYRLDGEIGALIDFLEIQLGNDNILIVLTSDHGAVDPMIESSKMPSGRFNSQQFAMLVNGFVGGMLGSGERWILDFSNNQIYLNRRLMFERGIDIVDVQNKIAAFAIQFSGVAQAITSNALKSSHFSDGVMSKAQNSYSQRHSGDVIINLLPGWAEDNGKVSDSGTPYNYDTHVPLLWYGGVVGTQNIARDVDMTDVAPTIAHIVQIAPPNASTGKPIIEIYVK